MNAKKGLLVVSGCCIMYACNQNKSNINSPVDTTVQAAAQQGRLATKKAAAVPDTIDITAAADSVVSVVLTNGASIVKGRYKGIGTKQYVEFFIAGGNMLHATLKPVAGESNIRINQIGLPGNTFDGPFGRELDYPIKSPGKYKILVGESLMADSRWKGNYLLTISTK